MLKLKNTDVKKVVNLLETWGKVLVISGYTDCVKKPWKFSPKEMSKHLAVSIPTTVQLTCL